MGTNFKEILIKTVQFSYKKICLQMPSEKEQALCFGLNVLRLNEIPVAPFTNMV